MARPRVERKRLVTSVRRVASGRGGDSLGQREGFAHRWNSNGEQVHEPTAQM